MLEQFLTQSWVRFPSDPRMLEWVNAARPVAEMLCHDPNLQAEWLRCGGTWFAGVNAFPNDPTGAVPDQGVPQLSGGAVQFVHEALKFTAFGWDKAQISVCYPGYPQPWSGESDAAFRFRRERDAAHVDGLRRVDPGRRRYPAEAHGFILGIPLNDAPEGAAPMVVYEGSHQIFRDAFRTRLADVAPDAWSVEDITDTYTAARREVFETCKRVTVTAKPGEAYIVHRLALHGVAPWTAASDDADFRMIAYFRPDPSPGASPAWWLEND